MSFLTRTKYLFPNYDKTSKIFDCILKSALIHVFFRLQMNIFQDFIKY